MIEIFLEIENYRVYHFVENHYLESQNMVKVANYVVDHFVKTTYGFYLQSKKNQGLGVGGGCVFVDKRTDSGGLRKY